MNTVLKYNFREFLGRSFNDVNSLPIFKAIASLPKIPPSTELESMSGVTILDSPNVMLAGGALRRTLTNQPLDSDLDLFFVSVSAFNFTLSILRQHNYETLYENDYNVTLQRKGDTFKVQLIKFIFPATPEELLDNFDFTICQFVLLQNEFYTTDMALWDLGRKRLGVNKISYAVSSVRRLLKYSRQGYTVCSGTIQGILTSVAEEPSIINSDYISLD